MSSFGQQNHDTMLRQAFYTFCSSENSSDMKLVGKDGFVNCHKIVILKVFPKLKTIFCNYCTESHEDIVIMFPEVDQNLLRKARDDLYLFGDMSTMDTLFKSMKHDDNITNKQDLIKEEEYEGDLQQVYYSIETDKILNSNHDNEAIMDDTVHEVDGTFIENTSLIETRLFGDTDKREAEREAEPTKMVEDEDNAAPMVYECDICHYKTFVGSYMKTHIQKEHAEEEGDSSENQIEKRSRELLCKICDMKFKSRSEINIHTMNEHDIAKKSKKQKKLFRCDVCADSFLSKRDLKVHTIDLHVPIKSFECDSCNDVFKSKKDLKGHTNEKHSHFSCESCGDEFQMKKELKAHINEKHTVEEEYPCTICAKQFKKQYIKQHMLSHTKIRDLKYSCQVCEFRSLTKIGLVVHKKKEHE